MRCVHVRLRFACGGAYFGSDLILTSESAEFSFPFFFSFFFFLSIAYSSKEFDRDAGLRANRDENREGKREKEN